MRSFSILDMLGKNNYEEADKMLAVLRGHVNFDVKIEKREFHKLRYIKNYENLKNIGLWKDVFRPDVIRRARRQLTSSGRSILIDILQNLHEDALPIIPHAIAETSTLMRELCHHLSFIYDRKTPEMLKILSVLSKLIFVEDPERIIAAQVVFTRFAQDMLSKSFSEKHRPLIESTVQEISKYFILPSKMVIRYKN